MFNLTRRKLQSQHEKISKNLLQLAYVNISFEVLLGGITVLVLVLIFTYNRNIGIF